MRHGSLFSGIGGFDLAAQWMGWENVFHCEINPIASKILQYYWPNAKTHNDITKTDFTIHRGSIDVLTGGFPCQPFSMAGKRKGKEDERYLWGEMLRAIREITPRYVVGENVLGLTNWNGGMVFDEVYSDLESAGYEVQAVVIPAAAVNAPHGRDRVWFVGRRIAADADIAPTKYPIQTRRDLPASSLQQINTNTNSNGRNQRHSEHEKQSSEGRQYALNDVKPVCDVTDTESEQGEWLRSEQRKFSDTQQGQLGRSNSGFGDGLTADTRNKRLERGAQFGGFTGSWTKRNKQPAGFFRTDWKNFPTQSPICGGDDGLPSRLDGITFSKWRNESIKAYGNAIVPQVVYQIFKAIETIDKEMNNG